MAACAVEPTLPSAPMTKIASWDMICCISTSDPFDDALPIRWYRSRVHLLLLRRRGEPVAFYGGELLGLREFLRGFRTTDASCDLRAHTSKNIESSWTNRCANGTPICFRKASPLSVCASRKRVHGFPVQRWCLPGGARNGRSVQEHAAHADDPSE